MSDLNLLWQRAKDREERARYGYVVRPVVARKSTALTPVKPVARPAASLADILGRGR